MFIAIVCALLVVTVRAWDSALYAQTGYNQLRLEQEFTDPLTTLPQLNIRDSYTPAMYGTDVQTNLTIVRPIVPRLPAYTLLPFPQLIRPTFVIATVPDAKGGSRTEFGDLPLLDILVLPWPDRKTTGLLFGLGPVFVFPTATGEVAGQGAWQAGPAFGAIYTGIPGFIAGVIIENPISFAYTSPDRPPWSALHIQPILAIHLFGRWYLRSAEANWIINWHHNSPTMIPLSLGIGRTFVPPGLPPMSFFVTGQWMAYRQFAPVVPQTSINFGMSIAFPGLRKWWRRP